MASQAILRRLGGGSEASWRRLEGILEASWRCFGGGLGRPGSALLGLGRDIGFIVDFLSIFSSLNDWFSVIFEQNMMQTYAMIDLSMQVTW